jgi:NADH:ubiquinone oxidoreductase subunit 6 (subunit J)
MTNGKLWKQCAIILLAILIVYSVTVPPWDSEMAPAKSNEDVAKNVFEEYGFTFLVLALLLAAAMIGGIYMAKMPKELGRYVEKGKVVVRKMKDRKPKSPDGGV